MTNNKTPQERLRAWFVAHCHLLRRYLLIAAPFGVIDFADEPAGIEDHIEFRAHVVARHLLVSDGVDLPERALDARIELLAAELLAESEAKPLQTGRRLTETQLEALSAAAAESWEGSGDGAVVVDQESLEIALELLARGGLV